MPLNEEEQRILAEIERQFHAQDPDSARRFGSSALSRYLARNCRWAALGFVAGLVIVVAAFATSVLLAVLGFLIMLASAVVFVKNVHKISRLGLNSVSRVLGGDGLGSAASDISRRLRRRLGGED